MNGNLVANFDLVSEVKKKRVSVTRTKTCEWCGAVATEEIFAFDADKSYYPRFTESGFGRVQITGFETKDGVCLTLNLCPQCLKELVDFVGRKERKGCGGTEGHDG